MKKLIYLFTLLLAVVACTPEVELREQPADFPGLEFTVDATDPNQPILTINDETVFNVNWSFDDGTVLQGTSVQCFYPLKGDYGFTIVAMNGKGQSTGTGSVKVPISNPSMVYDIPEFVSLCGEESEGSKVWVWAQNEPGGNVSYMTDPDDWKVFWWNPYTVEDETAENLPGLLNEIEFGLVGGFNYTRYESKDVVAEEGSFQLDVKNMTLKLAGAHLPNYNDENIDPDIAATGEYKIQILSDYELLLWQQHPTMGYSWAWKFKARDLEPVVDPIYKLAGEDGAGGKTWTFDHSGSMGSCYMTADYNWEESWWTPYSTLESVPEYNHTIKFDLDMNYTRFDGAGTAIENGTYAYNRKTGELILTDGHIPNFEARNSGDNGDSNLDLNVCETGRYILQIVEDDKLFVWQDHGPNNGGANDYGWAWIFKPVE
jgi:hypothetical protein